MTVNHPSDDPSTCCPACGGDGTVYDADDTRAALERARVVAVLDAWAVALGGSLASIRAARWENVAGDDPYLPHVILYYQEWSGEDDGSWVEKSLTYGGPTPDAARAAAAKAIEAGEV